MNEKRPSGVRVLEAISGGTASSPPIFVFPPFRLDASNQELWRGSARVALRPKPFAILRHLVERPRQLITKEELLTRLWPDEYVGEGVLKTYLAEIRRALGDSHKNPTFIETAHGRGYRFIGPLESSAPGEHVGPPPQSTSSLIESGPFGELPPVAGRAGELELLERALDKALHGERQVLFITGEAGIGKTLLVRSFLDAIHGRGDTLVAWGQCIDQYGAGEPYLPVLEALGRSCRGPEGAELLQALRQHAPTWLSLMPSAAVAAGMVRSELRAAPERMLREMAEAFEALTSKSALILWLDDVHWADPSTLDLISYLAQRTDPARLLLLAGYRVPEPTTHERLPILEQRLKMRDQSSELALQHLKEPAVGDYIAERFEQNGFPDALVALLHRRTSGNPLFMVKLVEHWLERGAFERVSGRWQLRQALDELAVDVPESLARMIEQQLSQLSEFERGVLEAASVAGPEFCSAALAAALSEEVTRIELLCTRWSRGGRFIRSKGHTEWPDGTESLGAEFIHALYRHVVYAQIGATHKAELHRRIAEREEVGHAARPKEVAAELAMHFERGHDFERAIRYLRLAAEHALSRGAYREAAEHLQRALGLLPKLGTATEQLELGLCLALGGPLTMIRGYAHPDVERVYTRARDLCRALGETPLLLAALAGIGGFFILRGVHSDGVQLCQQMLAVAGRFGDRDAEAGARLGLGILQLFHGDLELARANFEELMLRPAPGRDDGVNLLPYKQDQGVAVRCFSAYALAVLGFYDLALERARECLERARELGRPFAVVFGLQAVGFVHEMRGEYGEAQARARELLAICQTHGFKLHEAVATLACGHACVGLGQLELGIRLLRGGWGGYRLAGAALGTTYYQSRLLEAYLVAGDVPAAWEVFDQILGNVHRLDERWWEAELYRLQGELLRKGARPGISGGTSGAPETAESSFSRALELARQRAQKPFELRAATSLARLWCDRGQVSSGQELLADVYAGLSEGLDTLDAQTARALLETCATAGVPPTL